ncbi:hypothetical protein DLJ59_21380 [Micromonospora inaquosa]|uniref:Uncharacterized protein n=1 Tax=Micromonospora inaquosa TaxID=2203716 RepID=A0A3N9WZD8_9ACTN|nr:hypothetical protein DLJ59_21380 [Micromonospora inaquosa]
MTRPSPVSLRKNSRATGPVEPDGCGPSQPAMSGRSFLTAKRGGTAGHPGAPFQAYPEGSSSQTHVE